MCFKHIFPSGLDTKPTDLSMTIISSSCIFLKWRPPVSPTGLVTGYQVGVSSGLIFSHLNQIFQIKLYNCTLTNKKLFHSQNCDIHLL